MGFWKNLFGGRTKAQPIPVSSNWKPEIVNQGEEGPAIQVDPRSISHAFVAVKLADGRYAKHLDGEVANLNRQCQPRLWRVAFKAKFVTFAVNDMGDFPDITAVGPALESVGLKGPYSLAVNTITASLDGGKSTTNLLAGFAYPDSGTQLILARTDGFEPIADPSQRAVDDVELIQARLAQLSQTDLDRFMAAQEAGDAIGIARGLALAWGQLEEVHFLTDVRGGRSLLVFADGSALHVGRGSLLPLLTAGYVGQGPSAFRDVLREADFARPDVSEIVAPLLLRRDGTTMGGEVDGDQVTWEDGTHSPIPPDVEL